MQLTMGELTIVSGYFALTIFELISYLPIIRDRFYSAVFLR